MTAAVIALALVTLLGTKWDLLWCCIAIVVIVPFGAYLSLPLAIANASVMVYLVFLLYLNFPGGLYYFYTGSAECVPGGPQFSYTFYLTVGNLIMYTAGMVGAILFPPLFSRRRYQATFAVTTLLQVLASLFDLIIVERWNIAIGIPDHAMYIFGDAIVFQIVHVMTFMPVMVLISRLVPRGSESMVYSITAGFTNLGETMASSFGSILMEFRFPVTTTVPCDFSNLRYLIIIGHLCMPLAIIPLSFLLLPNCRVCDDVDIHGRLIQKRRRAGRSGPHTPPHDSKKGLAMEAEEMQLSTGDDSSAKWPQKAS
ncbi:hypothetical protein STCU_04284 [Strigomonas culicis]|uniref:Folate/pteridine transporter n=1 Tax=Strigomonas culicis TaxID=28005 RepID=S9UMN8_9TRYP|nr:hypothetical protein STCU_04284 [Strigomonas culicis]|eukprot:EPY30004.1 hypothetical protein STCU_04284 [Strigomonas culicis]